MTDLKFQTIIALCFSRKKKLSIIQENVLLQRALNEPFSVKTVASLVYLFFTYTTCCVIKTKYQSIYLSAAKWSVN